MKLINLVSLTLLTTVFGHSDSSANPVAVYELGINQSQDIPIITKHDTLLYLSDKFGISEGMSLSQSSEHFIDFLNLQHELHGNSIKPNLFISIKGIDRLNQQPTFKVSNKHVKQLLFKKFPKLLNKQGNKFYQLTPEIKLITKDTTQKLINHFEYFNEQLTSIWSKYTQSNTQQVLSYKLTNDKLFINELSQLIHLSKSDVSMQDIFFLELSSLLSIKRKIGQDSQTFQYSQQVLIDELTKLTEKFDITIIVEPEYNNDHIQTIHKRASELNSVFKRELSGVSGNGQFSSQESCEQATNNCTSHGKCIKVSNDKYGCACESTFNKTTSKTTNWAGLDCSKKDVSVETNLFLWTSIGLLVLLVGGIQLLSSIGNDPLPGVLDAATIPRKNI